ncbi:MAG: preprotein translocase subunit SecG [Alphaproteobacteria bacterium]
MGTVLLVIHLLVAIFLVAVILLQRSGRRCLGRSRRRQRRIQLLSARGTGNFLTRTTAILATIFIITSISLSLYYKGTDRHAKSILEEAPVAAEAEPSAPQAPVAWQVDEALKRK